MRRLLFAFLLGSYAFGVMDLHSWAHVPRVLLHLLEHHSDLGHHHSGALEHGHADDEDDHDPFVPHQHEACTTLSVASLHQQPGGLTAPIPWRARRVVPYYEDNALSAFSGSKWNPPRLG
ncbi:MAG: hypothetical protein JNM62_15355 [Flavobacteriales bacterium]|nr:hypothetical protein [Flavobacteriales bacterium]